jgi:hypothetical protein
MRKQVFAIAAMLGLMLMVTAAPVYAQSERTKTTAGVQEGICFSACFRSPQYYWFNLERLGDRIDNRGASVVIGGVNFNQPIGVAENVDLIRHFLKGSAFPGFAPPTPMARLNQEFLAAQLSLALAGGDGSPKAHSALNGQLQCHGGMIGFRPAVLSNGVALTPFSTLGELFEQALLAIRENRTADMDALAGLFNLLNGNDPSGNCFSTAKAVIQAPRDYPTIQEAVNAAMPGDVIKVGKGEFKGASVNKPVTLIGEGKNTRITSGVTVPRQLTDPGFPAVLTVAFLVSFGGSGATISNFTIELAPAFSPPTPAMGIGVHVRHADDVTVIHNEIAGPGLGAFNQFGGIYLLGGNRCTIAFNKVDGTYSGIELRSDPFINITTMNNQVVHNQIFNIRRGLALAAHRSGGSLGPEQPVQQNNFSYNHVQGDVGLNLLDLSGLLRDFISNNNFTHNDFRPCTTPLQENVPGLAGKNYFFMNLGL